MSCRLGLRLCLKWIIAKNRPVISVPARKMLVLVHNSVAGSEPDKDDPECWEL